MKHFETYTLIALIAAAFFIATVPTAAVPWTAAQSEGVTMVDVLLDTSTNTYTWTLTNLSGTDSSPIDDHVLVWMLQPFNVHSAVDWDAEMDGWTWNSSAGRWEYFQIDDPADKYYTPPALAPGESTWFKYTFDPTSAKINPFGENYIGNPDDIGFIAHVGAVEPIPTIVNESIVWTPTVSREYGPTWYDRSGYRGNIVPEPSSLAAVGTFVASLAGAIFRRRRSRSA